MRRAALHFEHIKRRNTDIEMLAHGPLIERIRRARQLDLAMQRLVRHAKQRAIGHPKPEPLRRNRAALHIHRNRAGEIDPASLLRPAQFPVPVIISHNCTGTKPPLERLAAIPVTLAAASCSATCTSASAGIGISVGTTLSRMPSSRK